MPAIRLFLAFPDGALHYVCAECTALCCRGQGFGGSLKREMGFLLETYPALQNNVTGRQGSQVSVATPSGRCFFLDGDNLCRVEKVHGKDKKPGVCTLFPFNVLKRIGRTVVVSPHFLCPLRLVVPPAPGQVEGSHGRIEAAVNASSLLDDGIGNLPELRLPRGETIRSVLKREMLFRDDCTASLGRGKFLDLLERQSSDAGLLTSRLSRAIAILGAPVPSRSTEPDTLDATFMALAPSLRLGLLQLSAEQILLALALGEALVRTSASLTPIDFTPQAVHGLFLSFQPVMQLLARSEAAAPLRKKVAVKASPFGDPDMVFSSFRAIRELSKGTGVFDALERTLPATLPRSDRMVLLQWLGARLDLRPNRKTPAAASPEA
jgi:hypothetical protein